MFSQDTAILTFRLSQPVQCALHQIGSIAFTKPSPACFHSENGQLCLQQALDE